MAKQKTKLPNIVAPQMAVIEDRRTKEFNNPTPITLDALLRCVYWSGGDFQETPIAIDVQRPCITSETTVQGITDNAVYARMTIDKKTGEVRIWSSYPTGNPTYLVHNAIQPTTQNSQRS